MDSYQPLGVDVRLNAAVDAVEKLKRGYRVLASVAGARLVVEADAVIHAAGRVPSLGGLNLSAAGVETERGA